MVTEARVVVLMEGLGGARAGCVVAEGVEVWAAVLVKEGGRVMALQVAVPAAPEALVVKMALVKALGNAVGSVVGDEVERAAAGRVAPMVVGTAAETVVPTAAAEEMVREVELVETMVAVTVGCAELGREASVAALREVLRAKVRVVRMEAARLGVLVEAWLVVLSEASRVTVVARAVRRAAAKEVKMVGVMVMVEGAMKAAEAAKAVKMGMAAAAC
jgi:hypothetical protein